MPTSAAMVPDISPHLPGCPSLAIERTARKIVRDLCQWGKVWRAQMQPVALLPTVVTYPVVPFDPDGQFDSFLSGHTTVDGNKRDLTFIAYESAVRQFSQWPESYASPSPQFVTMRGPAQGLMLIPVPEAVGTMDVFGTLIPTAIANSWDDALYLEFNRVVFHGVLAELMAMPERSWSSPKTAADHRRFWVYERALARARAHSDFTPSSLSIEMRPFA